MFYQKSFPIHDFIAHGILKSFHAFTGSPWNFVVLIDSNIILQNNCLLFPIISLQDLGVFILGYFTNCFVCCQSVFPFADVVNRFIRSYMLHHEFNFVFRICDFTILCIHQTQ